jgi:hypothetical protein
VNSKTCKQLSRIFLCIALLCLPALALAKRRAPAGGRIAIVVDERLSALRKTPALNGALLRRLGRGSLVAVRGDKRGRDGVVFYRVNVTSRTNGWVQRDALVSPTRAGDDGRLLRLINGSTDFDRIARARIFLDNFSASPLRPEVLVIYALAAEEVAAHLSRDAGRRLVEAEMAAGGAPVFSYFLNFNGLDRYNRQGITFVFDSRSRKFHYDGEAWEELVHRYPRSPQAEAARKRLAQANLQSSE